MTQTQPPQEKKQTGFRQVVGSVNQRIEDIDVPDIFPMFKFYGTRPEQFGYLRGELDKQAAQGTLSPTWIHNQPKPIPDYCGMIIMGLEFQESSNRMVSASAGVPMELSSYMVKIRARKRNVALILDSDHVTPKKGIAEKVPLHFKVGKIAGELIKKGQGEAVGSTKWVDVYQESDLMEAELALPYAWKILHQNGAHCVRARRQSLREKMWLSEEVVPEHFPSTETDGGVYPGTSEPHFRTRRAK